MQVPQFQFNANQYEPNQGYAIHPPALKVPFQITNTTITENSKKTGHILTIEFTSPLGSILNRYNVNNPEPKTVEIAFGQLSALCRAVGIYQIDGNNECAALRGGKGLMDVGYQKDEEPHPDYPGRKGYTELKKVYDINGNEPGKAPQQQAQPQQQPNAGFTQQGQPSAAQQPAPLQQQPGGNWGTQPAQQQQAPQGQPNGQGGGIQQAQPQGQAWQPGQGGQPAANPPWGTRI